MAYRGGSMSKFTTDHLDHYSLQTKGHDNWAYMDSYIIEYLQSFKSDIDYSPPNTDQLDRKISSVVIFYEDNECDSVIWSQEEEDAWEMSE